MVMFLTFSNRNYIIGFEVLRLETGKKIDELLTDLFLMLESYIVSCKLTYCPSVVGFVIKGVLISWAIVSETS